MPSRLTRDFEALLRNRTPAAGNVFDRLAPLDAGLVCTRNRDWIARMNTVTDGRAHFYVVPVRNLFAAINARREIAINRFIFALGIRHVGETNARRLARHFGTLEALREVARAAGDPASEARAELNGIEGVGDVVAEAVAGRVACVAACVVEGFEAGCVTG